MKFKTKPGKKGRSKYLPRKEGKKINSKYSSKQQKTPRTRKEPMTFPGYQAKKKRFDKLQGKRASTLIQAAKLYGQREKLSREMEAWRNWRVPEIQKELEALENKDRSRRRGANKNKWTEVDLKRYAKLQEELKQIDPIYASRRRFNIYFDENSNRVDVGAMVKKYYDYLDKGIIKPREFIDHYDQATWMSTIMTIEEVKDALAQADEWRQKGLENQLKRQKEQVKIFEKFN